MAVLTGRCASQILLWINEHIKKNPNLIPGCSDNYPVFHPGYLPCLHPLQASFLCFEFVQELNVHSRRPPGGFAWLPLWKLGCNAAGLQDPSRKEDSICSNFLCKSHRRQRRLPSFGRQADFFTLTTENPGRSEISVSVKMPARQILPQSCF